MTIRTKGLAFVASLALALAIMPIGALAEEVDIADTDDSVVVVDVAEEQDCSDIEVVEEEPVNAETDVDVAPVALDEPTEAQNGDGSSIPANDGETDGPDGPTDPVDPVEPIEPVEPVEPVDPYDPSADDGTNVYRLYNRWTGEHFYTTSFDEATGLVEVGWNWEGAGWVSPSEGDEVYRLYNSYAGDHHYTTSADERDELVAAGWTYENVSWLSLKDGLGGGVEVLRQYNPYATSGTHNFTCDSAENDHLVDLGWIGEGVAWRSLDKATNAIEPFWAIQENGDRWWVQEDASYAADRIVTPEEGAGYYAYATSNGAVVRGACDRGDGTAWIGDATTGELATEIGWVETSRYAGSNQLYYLTEESPNYSVAIINLFMQDGNTFYGIPDKGYVVRGTYDAGEWVYFADLATGVLPTASGWSVTDSYGQGLQRYYLEDGPLGFLGAKEGYSTGGYAHYTLPNKGYVLRGMLDKGAWIYFADNDGRVPTTSGFVSSSAYGQGARRYYFEKGPLGFLGVHEGYQTSGGTPHYTYPNKGYLLTENAIIGGRYYKTDSTGRIATSITGTNNAQLDAWIEWIIVNKCGTTGEAGLRAAYNYIRSCPYISSSHIYDTHWQNWAEEFALQFKSWGGGNCYRYASTMTYTAIALGYKADVVIGYANNLQDHGWCEITTDDGYYRVIDCSLGNSHAYPDINWFLISYHDARIGYYSLGHVLYDYH